MLCDYVGNNISAEFLQEIEGVLKRPVLMVSRSRFRIVSKDRIAEIFNSYNHFNVFAAPNIDFFVKTTNVCKKIFSY